MTSIANAGSSLIEDAESALNEELRQSPASSRRVVAMARQAMSRLTESGVLEMRARYDVARALYEFRHRTPRQDVAQTIAAVAEVLGIHQSALRRWVRVSGVISPKEFESHLLQCTKRWGALTWSHLELLAEVRSAQLRRELAIRCAEGDLSVRALAAAVRDGCAEMSK